MNLGELLSNTREVAMMKVSNKATGSVVMPRNRVDGSLSPYRSSPLVQNLMVDQND